MYELSFNSWNQKNQKNSKNIKSIKMRRRDSRSIFSRILKPTHNSQQTSIVTFRTTPRLQFFQGKVTLRVSFSSKGSYFLFVSNFTISPSFWWGTWTVMWDQKFLLLFLSFLSCDCVFLQTHYRNWFPWFNWKYQRKKVCPEANSYETETIEPGIKEKNGLARVSEQFSGIAKHIP